MKTFIALIFVSGLAIAAAVSGDVDTEQGKAMYGSKKFRCYKCHGPTGKEGGLAPSFKGIGKRYDRNGIMERAAHNCPPSGVCNPKEPGAIVDYLRTL